MAEAGRPAETGPPLASVARGVAYGLGAAFAWAIYNVGVKIGRNDGFSSADLALLRYLVPAILLAPVMMVRWRRGGGRIGLARAAALTVAVGPPFAFLINTGYGLAPLAHAVVISPGVTMLVANLLSVVIDRRPMPLNRQVGIAVLVLGLLFIALDQGTQVEGEPMRWLGDLCFIGSGSLWGIFTYMIGRWRLDAVETTATAAICATIVFVPTYLVFFTPADQPVIHWLEQIAYQGVLGGCLAIVAYALSIGALGAELAGLFPALVPPLAVLLAIPLTATWPNATQWTGIALATLGLVLSLDLARRALRAARAGREGKKDEVKAEN